MQQTRPGQQLFGDAIGLVSVVARADSDGDAKPIETGYLCGPVKALQSVPHDGKVTAPSPAPVVTVLTRSGYKGVLRTAGRMAPSNAHAPTVVTAATLLMVTRCSPSRAGPLRRTAGRLRAALRQGPDRRRRCSRR